MPRGDPEEADPNKCLHHMIPRVLIVRQFLEYSENRKIQELANIEEYIAKNG